MSYRFLLTFIFALASTEAVLCSSSASAQTPLTSAVVQNLRKQVRLMPSNQQPRAARIRDILRPGDALATARSSLAELRFNDQSLARIGEQALFHFTPNTRTFDLRNGTVLLLIPRGQGVTRMKTPNAAAGIKGSALFVRYNQATNTSFFGALTQSQIEISNHDHTQSRVLQPGEMATVVNDQLVSVQTFDLKTFYETSTLVEGLQLTQPNASVGADPALDGVREETSDALKNQAPVRGEGVIETPSSLKMPQTLAENAFPSDLAAQPIAPATPGLIGASPINLPPAVISVDAAGKPLKVIPGAIAGSSSDVSGMGGNAKPASSSATTGVVSGNANSGTEVVGQNQGTTAQGPVSGVVSGSTSSDLGAGQQSQVGSQVAASGVVAASARSTTAANAAVTAPGPAPASEILASSQHQTPTPSGTPTTPTNTPSSTIVTPTVSTVTTTTPAGAVLPPTPSVSASVSPSATVPVTPAAALAPTLPSITPTSASGVNPASSSYTAPTTTVPASSAITVTTPVVPTVSTVTPTVSTVTPAVQPTVLTPSQSTPVVASPVVSPSVVVTPTAAPAATVQSIPVTTTPVTTTPVTTTPVTTTPVVTTPVVATPVVATPVVATPVVTTPVVTTPAAVAAPAVITPVTTTPVTTTPVTTTPVTTPTVTTPTVTTPTTVPASVPSSSGPAVPLTQAQTPAATSF